MGGIKQGFAPSNNKDPAAIVPGNPAPGFTTFPPPTHHPPPSQDESGMNQDKIDVIGDAGVRLRPLS